MILVEDFNQEEQLLFSIGFQNQPQSESEITTLKESAKQGNNNAFDDPIDFFASDDRIQPITLDNANKDVLNLLDDLETNETNKGIQKDLNEKLSNINNDDDKNSDINYDLSKEPDVIKDQPKYALDIPDFESEFNESIELKVNSCIADKRLNTGFTHPSENPINPKSTTLQDEDRSLKKINEKSKYLPDVAKYENIPSNGNENSKDVSEIKEIEEQNVIPEEIKETDVTPEIVKESGNLKETIANEKLDEPNQDILDISNLKTNISEKNDEHAIPETAFGSEAPEEKIVEEKDIKAEVKPESLEKHGKLEIQEEKSATSEIEKSSKTDSDIEATEDKTSESDVADGACLGKSTMEDDQTDNSNMELDDLKAKVLKYFFSVTFLISYNL